MFKRRFYYKLDMSQLHLLSSSECKASKEIIHGSPFRAFNAFDVVSYSWPLEVSVKTDEAFNKTTMNHYCFDFQSLMKNCGAFVIL